MSGFYVHASGDCDEQPVDCPSSSPEGSKDNDGDDSGNVKEPKNSDNNDGSGNIENQIPSVIPFP